MSVRFVSLIASCCVLASCVPVATQPVDDVQVPQVTASSASRVPEPVEYADYRDGVLGRGQKAVLFFYAPWFPFCTENDLRLKALYASGGIAVPTYRVNYDGATELRLEYTVVTQDTFVLVDGDGTRLSAIVHPDDAELRTMLGLPPLPLPVTP